MKRFFLIVVGLAILIFISCKKDDENGTLTLHFKPLYDGETLTTFTTLPFENGQQIEFSHMSMFISDLELIDQNTSKSLDEIELVDMSFGDIATSEAGYTLKISGINPGDYDGLQFGVGVPADLNQKKPADFPSSNPLSKTGYYWTAWNSYIFMKTEGRLDTVGTGTLDLGFALHSGSDALFRSLVAQLPITIESGKETVIDIVVDYKKLFEGIDIKANPQNHTPDDTSTIEAVADNLASAFAIVQ